ncbi:MAG TPA: glycosyltransferase family 2 protein [Myxococcota bacterium]
MRVAASHPRVVALVPAFTAAEFIAATLDTLAAQSHPNLEILVSDDASPDGTAAICERYAARDARFRLIRQPRNLGWTGNVNALLGEARGDYFCIAGHDDRLEPGYVERCVAALEANPRAVLAFTDLMLVKADGRRELKSYAVLDGVSDRGRRARRIARRTGAHWIPYRGVFRAPAARAVGGLRRHGAGEFSADWPWLLQLSLLGEFVRIPEPLYTKISRPQGLSRDWNRRKRSWSAVTGSAMAAVSRAEVPSREKLALYANLGGTLAWRRLRAKLRSVAGGERSPRSPAPGARPPAQARGA